VRDLDIVMTGKWDEESEAIHLLQDRRFGPLPILFGAQMAALILP
jgi:hypothetical protein